MVIQSADVVADQATLVLKLSVIDCSALSTEIPEVTMSSVNLISGVISGSFSVPVPPQPAISVAMATALRKVSNFLIMVLNANLLIAIDDQAKRNDRDYFEFIGGLLITRIFAK